MSSLHLGPNGRQQAPNCVWCGLNLLETPCPRLYSSQDPCAQPHRFLKVGRHLGPSKVAAVFTWAGVRCPPSRPAPNTPWHPASRQLAARLLQTSAELHSLWRLPLPLWLVNIYFFKSIFPVYTQRSFFSIIPKLTAITRVS